jgi:Uma2 family endonuclease
MATAVNSELAPPWLVSVDRYHAMIEAGILGPEDKLELLEGVIVEKMSKKPPHSFTTGTSRDVLDNLIPEGWFVSTQNPITLATSEPEPDVAVIRGKLRDYRTHHPGACDVGLVIEVSESSIDRDRVLKKRIYAQAEIPFYWIIDLNKLRLELYARPVNGQYTECTVYSPGDVIPVILDGVEVGTIPLDSLLP